MLRSRDALVPVAPKTRIAVLWVAALYCGVVAIVAILGPSSQGPVAIAFSLYMCVLFLPIAVPRLGGSWFHPLVFHSLWTFVRWVLPKTGVYASGLDVHPALPEYTPEALTSVVTYGLFLETISLASTYIGFLLVRTQRPRLRVAFSGSRFLRFGLLVAIAISGVAFLFLGSRAGGLEGLLLQRGLRRDMRVVASVGGHWSVLVTFLTTACLVWAGLRPDAFKRPTFWVLFLSGLALRFAATGSRAGVVFPIVLAIIIWSLHNRRLPYTRVVTLAVIALVAVAVLGQFRAATFTASSLDEIQIDMSFSDSLQRGVATLVRYATGSHSFYPIIARVPSEVDLMYGASYLTMLAAPIPRALWPDKPIAPGSIAARVFYDNPFNAIPTGAVGEAYWNFHIPGVIIVFIVWGMCLKLMLNGFEYKVFGDGTLPLYVIALHHFHPSTDAIYGLLHTIVPAVLFLCLYSGLPRLHRHRQRLG